MNLPEIVLIVLLAVALGLAILEIIRRRKRGGCCGDCAACAMRCTDSQRQKQHPRQEK